jgi:acyl-CoA thioesterase YciA
MVSQPRASSKRQAAAEEARRGVAFIFLSSPEAHTLRRWYSRERKMPVDRNSPRGKITIRLRAMPADTNHHGDIFGGWVLSQMDSACGIVASERSRGRAVTVKVDYATFIKPIKVGDIVCVYTDIEKVGHTSMHIFVDFWVKRFPSLTHEKVAEGRFVFVAIDESGRPRPVPPEP